MKTTKGIILAGGLGTRLYPLTKVTNKHLLPVGGKPMINHPIERLVDAGVTDIMIVTGVEHCGGIMSLLGSGADYGCSFTYKVQDQPDGIAGALKLCKNFVNDSNCVVLLGDNIFKENLKIHIKSFNESEKKCKLFFKKVGDPRRYGVGVFENKRLVKVEEKPKKPKTNLAGVGVYFYSKEVFDVIDSIGISEREEYEITSVNNIFIDKKECDYAILEKKWVDAGTMDSYHNTSWLMYKEV